MWLFLNVLYVTSSHFKTNILYLYICLLYKSYTLYRKIKNEEKDKHSTWIVFFTCLKEKRRENATAADLQAASIDCSLSIATSWLCAWNRSTWRLVRCFALHECTSAASDRPHTSLYLNTDDTHTYIARAQLLLRWPRNVAQIEFSWGASL